MATPAPSETCYRSWHHHNAQRNAQWVSTAGAHAFSTIRLEKQGTPLVGDTFGPNTNPHHHYRCTTYQQRDDGHLTADLTLSSGLTNQGTCTITGNVTSGATIANSGTMQLTGGTISASIISNNSANDLNLSGTVI